MNSQAKVAFLESNLSGSGFQAFKIAKEKGYHVTLLTRDLQRYVEIPMGRHYIDRYVDDIIFCETNRLEPTFKALQEKGLDHGLSAFLTLAEYDVVNTAAIAERLGLKRLNPKAAQICRNKHHTRLACTNSGVPSPQFAAVNAVAGIDEATARIGFPCIVKPADETSSTDVVVCFTRDEAIEHFKAIRGKVRNVRGQERYEFVLVEEYVVGQEVSVETVTEDGRTTVLGVTDKFTGGGKHFVETGHSFPSSLNRDTIQQCCDTTIRALEATGYDNGVAHVELKISHNGPQLIEINARPAGDRIPDLVKLTTGFDPVKAHVEIFLEGTSKEVLGDPRSGAAISFLTSQPGRIEAVVGVDIASDCVGVIEVSIGDLVGRKVEPLTRSATRLGYVIAQGGNGYEAYRNSVTAVQQVQLSIS